MEIKGGRLRKSFKLLLKILAVNAAILFALLCLFEAAWHYCLHHTEIFHRLPSPLRIHLRNYYADHVRDIIQYDEHCARFDKELFYTLKPGACTFSNIEFRTEVKINSLGVRGGEEDLSSPEAAVLGDSFAMGWGVGQDQSFPALVGARTGKRLLNVSVSSYGTAREVALLNRAGARTLKYLIVQYATDDLGENMFFYNNGTSGPAVYEKLVADLRGEKRYFPGKHVYNILTDIYKRITNPHASSPPLAGPDEEADIFIETLMRANLDFSRVKIIVLSVERFAANSGKTAETIKGRIKREGLPPSIKNMTVLDVSPLLTEDDYFVLDDHINERGHAKLAAAIVDAMGENR